MAVEFPSSPTLDDIYTDPTTGQSWQWDGTKWVAAASVDAAIWDRTGTTVSPATTGDVVSISAGTAALPGLTAVGDTNTGIYSPGADIIGLSTAGTERARIDSSGNFSFDSGYGSAAVAYGCRAWVNFNGTFGTSPFTVANGGIRASGNVSSITDNGTGSYTVNFTTAMPDANYAAVASQSDGTDALIRNPAVAVDRATTSCRVDCEGSSGTQQDAEVVDLIVLR